MTALPPALLTPGAAEKVSPAQAALEQATLAAEQAARKPIPSIVAPDAAATPAVDATTAAAPTAAAPAGKGGKGKGPSPTPTPTPALGAAAPPPPPQPPWPASLLPTALLTPLKTLAALSDLPASALAPILLLHWLLPVPTVHFLQAPVSRTALSGPTSWVTHGLHVWWRHHTKLLRFRLPLPLTLPLPGAEAPKKVALAAAPGALFGAVCVGLFFL